MICTTCLPSLVVPRAAQQIPVSSGRGLSPSEEIRNWEKMWGAGHRGTSGRGKVEKCKYGKGEKGKPVETWEDSRGATGGERVCQMKQWEPERGGGFSIFLYGALSPECSIYESRAVVWQLCICSIQMEWKILSQRNNQSETELTVHSSPYSHVQTESLLLRVGFNGNLKSSTTSQSQH